MIPVLDLEKDLIDQFEDIRVFLFEKDKLFKRFFFLKSNQQCRSNNFIQFLIDPGLSHQNIKMVLVIDNVCLCQIFAALLMTS